MSDCSQCSALAAQVAQLRHQVDFLQQQLSALLAGVRGTARLIDRETEQPSMPRHRLVHAIRQRLSYLLEVVEGRRV
jgi:anti-sigma factor RsiW